MCGLSTACEEGGVLHLIRKDREAGADRTDTAATTMQAAAAMPAMKHVPLHPSHPTPHLGNQLHVLVLDCVRHII
jgi:hypothetical protein